MAEYIINQSAGIYKRAMELYDEGKFKDAVPLLEDVVLNDSENHNAEYFLAECLYHGKGCAVDHKRAFSLYYSAAANKITEACYMVGLCYLQATGTYEDFTQSVAWFTEAAKYAHPMSQYYLGLAYMNGKGITRDIPRAAQWLVHAAKMGIVDAQKNAAICYEALGKFKGAARLYLAGADNGDSYCMEKIADCFADGIGCSKCEDLAIHYYEQAANAGNFQAQNNMAKRYYSGNGVPQSTKNAIFWWMKAAAGDVTEAQNSLAECYYSGDGVFKSYSQAIQWWTKAANAGNIAAMQHLAEVAMNPEDGREKDPVNCKYWWTKAAEKGDPYSMFKLGECFEYAIGHPSADLEEAYKWYRAASNLGSDEATEALTHFKSKGGKIRKIK
ncbi:MAG: SEL1-like repeat protein [Acholeplasmatales bacterium]|nr:SEL1-like repeat protein [Acholeplasmatales bacterium]